MTCGRCDRRRFSEITDSVPVSLTISIASKTVSVRISLANRQPTIILEYTSMMKHTYATRAQVATNVTSITHNWWGGSAVNTLFAMPGWLVALGSAVGCFLPFRAQNTPHSDVFHDSLGLVPTNIDTCPAGRSLEFAQSMEYPSCFASKREAPITGARAIRPNCDKT
jgi:hypothetical protein